MSENKNRTYGEMNEEKEAILKSHESKMNLRMQSGCHDCEHSQLGYESVYSCNKVGLIEIDGFDEVDTHYFDMSTAGWEICDEWQTPAD